MSHRNQPLPPGMGAALLLGTVLGGACSSTPVVPTSTVASIPVVYSEDFAGRAAMDDWAFSDAKAWDWTDRGGRSALELLGGSTYEPPHRSPTSIALLPRILVGDFDLDVDLLQTGRNYGHRDMCLFFGFQSPARYYYVHLATTPDENAHNIFMVHDAPRTNLAEVAEAGIDWGDDVWHHVRIERRVQEGTIRVFWDYGSEPILSAVDTTLDSGRIGFGSFDDSGCVTNIELRAPRVVSSSGPGNPFR